MFVIYFNILIVIYLIVYFFFKFFNILGCSNKKLQNKFFLFFNNYLIYLKKNNLETKKKSTFNFKHLYTQYIIIHNKNLDITIQNFLLITFIIKKNINQFILYIIASKMFSCSNSLHNANYLQKKILTIHTNKSKQHNNFNSSNFIYIYTFIYNSANMATDLLLNNINITFLRIKYWSSHFIKYINYKNLNEYSILYLRKSKNFNKGRYSRNRQYYRTGVYWCLYINIILIIGLYFWFYRLTMNFSYLWWLLFLFIISAIVPKTIKYKLYLPKLLFTVLLNNLLWCTNILVNLIKKFVFIPLKMTVKIN